VIRLEVELAAHRRAIAPRQKQLQAERDQRIAKREAEMKTHEESLVAGLVEWEQQLRISSSRWVHLDPTELKTTIPGKLVRESDSSIFADVKKGKGEYSIVGAASGKRITSVRLEALLDDRLPKRGPGFGSGNFVLTEFYAAVLTGEGGKKTELKFAAARADFSQGGYDVATAIDGKTPESNNGWAVSPQVGKPHVAVFELSKPLELHEGDRLEFRLLHSHVDSKHRLGRFRLSTSNAELPVGFGLPGDIELILAIDASKRSKKQSARLVAYRKQHDEQFKALEKTLAEARRPVPKEAKLAKLEKQLAAVSKPLPVDVGLRRLEEDVALSSKQLKNNRLTAAQDLTWALINSPAFLYNH
jgi:hypothetical protein